VRRSLRILQSLFTTVYDWANWVSPNFSEFLYFLSILFSVESVFLEWTVIVIDLIFVFVLWQPLDQCPIAALTSKSLSRISSGKHELCNLQENSTKNYNCILPTIYMKSSWSVLRLHFYCAIYPKVHVSSMSTPCVHHEIAMWLICSLISSSRLFLTSLDSSRPF